MEYPVSLDVYKQFLNNIRLKKHYKSEIEKLDLFSSKSNFDDYTYIWKDIKFDINPSADLDDISLSIQKYFQNNDFYHILNKAIFLYEEEPYTFDILKMNTVCTATICCLYDRNTKKSSLQSILDLKFIGLSKPINFFSDLDTAVQRILNLSNIKIGNMSYKQQLEIEAAIDLSHFIKMYEPDDPAEKIRMYLSKRKLI